MTTPLALTALAVFAVLLLGVLWWQGGAEFVGDA